MVDSLDVFADWLIDYCDQPVDDGILRIARVGACTTDEAVTIGHRYALVSVMGALRGVMKCFSPCGAPSSHDRDYEAALIKLFSSRACLREAGAGGSNPLTPTIEIKDITDN